jgi:hypothetical protein
MYQKNEYLAKLEDGTPVRFFGVTSSGHFVWTDEQGNDYVPSEKSYKKKGLKNDKQIQNNSK